MVLFAESSLEAGLQGPVFFDQFTKRYQQVGKKFPCGETVLERFKYLLDIGRPVIKKKRRWAWTHGVKDKSRAFEDLLDSPICKSRGYESADLPVCFSVVEVNEFQRIGVYMLETIIMAVKLFKNLTSFRV